MSSRNWFEKSLKRPTEPHIFLWLATAAALLVGTLPFSVSALTTISQGYTATEKLSLGSIVSLQANSSDQVVAASSSNPDSLFGVVINADSSLLSVSTGEDNQVQVATSGTAIVLVSDINGPIERGDHITASPIGGVGMKATGNVRVIGTAEGAMENASKQTYKDKNGGEQSVMIGQTPVQINVAYYFKEPDKTLVPSAVQNIANALAGRSVSATPILISAAIFLVMIIVVSSMVYSMIKSSIISVGRNPMAQSAVYRDLLQMSAIVLVILAVGFSSIYLVLTKA